MPNYQDGKIYKIYNTINDDIYIGSTTQKLCERMRNHRNDHKSKLHFNFPIYKAFREHGVENFFIELIEKCPCNDKDELMKTEGNYIRTLKSSLNARIAGRTDKEYYGDNRDILLQKQREYNENNREKYYKDTEITTNKTGKFVQSTARNTRMNVRKKGMNIINNTGNHIRNKFLKRNNNTEKQTKKG